VEGLTSLCDRILISYSRLKKRSGGFVMIGFSTIQSRALDVALSSLFLIVQFAGEKSLHLAEFCLSMGNSGFNYPSVS
jgi:hypothetical protein